MMMMLVDTAITVPVNVVALTDDTDFKTRETAVVYNQAGMDLVWNFVTAAGVISQTAVTPTTGGVYDWSHIGDGMYKVEIPASGGASINNDTEGYGYFTGICTGVLAWRGPTIQFSPAHIVNGLVTGTDNLQVDTAQVGGTSQTAGDVTAIATAIPTTAMRGTDSSALASVCTEVRLATLTDWIDGGRLDLLIDAIKAVADAIPDSGALTSIATAAGLSTAQSDLDTLTGADGATLATTQSNYSPATAAALTAAQSDLTQVKADLPTQITKNTELQSFPFLMVESSDNVTPATGLTVTATRAIDGGAFAACANSVTEISSGWYKITLSAADLNGGTIALRFAATAANDRNVTIVTQP